MLSIYVQIQICFLNSARARNSEEKKTIHTLIAIYFEIVVKLLIYCYGHCNRRKGLFVVLSK